MIKFSNFRTKQKVLVGVLSPMILLLVLGGVAAFNINQITERSKWVDHTHNVLREA